MSNHDNDNNFNDYLSGNSDLSKVYRDADNSKTNAELPASDLDNSILAAAKREVNSKPKKNSSPFTNNYFIPLSTAASILIVFTMVSFFPDEQVIEFEPAIIMGELDSQQDSTPDNQKLEDKRSQKAKADNKTKQNATLAKRSKVKKEQSNKTFRKKINSKPTDIKTGKVILNESKKPLPQFDYPGGIIKPRISPLEKKAIATENITEDVVEDEDITVEMSLDSLSSSSRMADAPTQPLSTELMNDPVTTSSSIHKSKVAQSPVEELLRKDQSEPAISPLIDSDLIYDEFNWKYLPAEEWIRRIKAIYYKRGEKDVHDIITIFNDKFPKLKITIQDIIDNDN
ncbi:MAG: hypothetical protein ACC653_02835 [Gammaproteobacteria bacterium]